MNELPDEERVANALHYLSMTDEECAGLKAAVRAGEYLLKHYRAKAMAASDEKSIAAKETDALASEAYANAVSDYQETIAEYETVAAKRQRAILTIDVWRSLNANRRQS